MESCFKCGITSEKAILMDAITDKKIVKICQKCSRNEDIPIIRKPSFLRIEESEKPKTVYERMRKVAGIEKERDIIKEREIKKQDANLREIVDRNFKSNFKKAESHEDLIENFHWVLMRARRLKKVTSEQLAKNINESTECLKMAEKGILPADYLKLVQKIENYLGVNLIKREKREIDRAIEVVPSEVLGKPEEIYEKDSSKIITIEDLKNLRNRYEEGVLKEDNLPEFIRVEEKDLEKLEERELTPEEVDEVLEKEVEASKKVSRFSNFFKRKKETSEKYVDNSDISQEEVDRIIFGK